MDTTGDFYKKAIIDSFSEEDDRKYILFKKIAPLAKKLKFKAKDRDKYRDKGDLFNSSKDVESDFSSDSSWGDKDFAFQIAYEMEDLKSVKWYEHIVERCDKQKERQLILRARGEVYELKDTSEEPKNKGAYFSRLIRKYSQERGISLAEYGSTFKSDLSISEKRDIIRRKRKDTGKIIRELKETLSIEELCRYHKLAMEVLKKECGSFFTENNIDIPGYVIEGYITKVIAKDYDLNLPDN